MKPLKQIASNFRISVTKENEGNEVQERGILIFLFGLELKTQSKLGALHDGCKISPKYIGRRN